MKIRDESMPMTSADFETRWPAFSKRLSAALKHDGRALLQQGVRLQLAESVCVRQQNGTVLNAAIAILRNGLRESSVAGLHVTQLRDKEDGHRIEGLSRELTAAGVDWLAQRPPLGILPSFTYP